jgi:hypothetical protein
VFYLRLHFIVSMVFFTYFGAGMIPLEISGKARRLAPDMEFGYILRLCVMTKGTWTLAFGPSTLALYGFLTELGRRITMTKSSRRKRKKKKKKLKKLKIMINTKRKEIEISIKIPLLYKCDFINFGALTMSLRSVKRVPFQRTPAHTRQTFDAPTSRWTR